MKKKSKVQEIENKLPPGVYITKAGICRVIGISRIWLDGHIYLLDGVSNLFCNSREYFCLSDFYMILNPSTSRKEADAWAFSNAICMKNLCKIIIEEDA